MICRKTKYLQTAESLSAKCSLLGLSRAVPAAHVCTAEPEALLATTHSWGPHPSPAVLSGCSQHCPLGAGTFEPHDPNSGSRVHFCHHFCTHCFPGSSPIARSLDNKADHEGNYPASRSHKDRSATGGLVLGGQGGGRTACSSALRGLQEQQWHRHCAR